MSVSMSFHSFNHSTNGWTKRRNAMPGDYSSNSTSYRLRSKHSSAYPKKYTYSEYLFIRIKTIPNWRRKYFVLKDNFLLCGNNPYSDHLLASIPLEKCKVSDISLTIKHPDQKTKDLVFGYINQCQKILHANITIFNIPPLLYHQCLVFYYECGPDNTMFQLLIPKTLKRSKHRSKLKRKVYFCRADSEYICNKWREYIAKASTLSVKDIYRMRYYLKRSNTEHHHRNVYAAKHRVSNEEVAIKIFDKIKCNASKLLRDIQIVKTLSNPYIVRLCDLFEMRHYLYVVMELCRCTLLDKIANLDYIGYCKINYCQIMHQIAAGVQYMHNMGMIHRDLHPENILCVGDSINRVKIADYGLSGTSIDTKNRCVYLAPEIRQNQGYAYGKEVDYWSLGAIAHVFLCGYTLKTKIVDEHWNHVEESTTELVKYLLVRDPIQRANCTDIEENIWQIDVSNIAFQISHNKLKKLHRKL
eukprot:202936_1